MMLDLAMLQMTAIGLATGVARSSVIYALVSASHVLGIALLMGPIMLVDLRLLGALRALDLAALAILRRAAMFGVLIVLPSGALLFAAKPIEYAANPAMQMKLIVAAAGLLNALAFEWRARRVGLANAVTGLRAAVMGAGSLVLWLTALLLGRWIAFV